MKCKQWLAAALALILIFGTLGCTGETTQPPTEATDEPTAPVETPTATDPEPSAPTETEEPTELPTEPPTEEEPLPNVGPETMQTLHSLVTAENVEDYDFSVRAMAYLTETGAIFPNRRFGGLGMNNRHGAVGDWIVSELKAGGYDAAQIKVQSFEGLTMYRDSAKGRNIILTIPGEDPTKQILVGGHYDGDGLGDNGSGLALLLATAIGLYGITPHYTVKILFFDAGDDGLFGSSYYAKQMTEEEVASTVYMINVEALVFGDFCNLYGGTYGDYSLDKIAVSEDSLPEAEATEGYEFAASLAETLGIKVYRTADLDGYYDENGAGMEPEDALFTNPWTNEHPAPSNMLAPSPATIPSSDHVAFANRGIRYIFFQATNWWAAGEEPYYAYTSRVETYNTEYGLGGMFMKTEFDTYELLTSLFPGRAEAHFSLFSRLLSALLLVEPEAE